MIRKLNEVESDYDIVVIGAGGAGMAAALFGAIACRKVLLVERTEFLGGTTALSAATTWVPGNRHSVSVNPDDTPDKALRFLDEVVGNHAPRTMRQAFVEAGAKAIDLLEDMSEVRFRPYATHPDYEQQAEGATMRGRAMEPLPFDGRELGDALDLIRPPIPEFTIFGGMMVDRTDINHLLALKKKLSSFRHSFRILSHYGLDRLTGRKRGSRLVMGNALIGRLLKSLLDRKVDIILSTEITALVQSEREDRGVEGVILKQGNTERSLAVKGGVVLAAGGYGRNPKRREEMLHSPTPAYSPAAPGHTGAAQDLALSIGARFGEGGADNAFWAPVSVRQRPDGTTAVFPHFVMDRSKPGTVCVNQRGERFTNESSSYHLFARAMFEANKNSPTIPCWIITDALGLKRYGLGMIRMGTADIRSFLADGYLTQGQTVSELAVKIGADPAVLENTVRRMNAYAKTGLDPEFGRGTTAYHKVNGDATRGTANPTLGPIETGPFYAVRLFPGDIGASTGLAISPDAEVLGQKGAIPGLYACGNEAQSVMGGTYPGPGITIGSGLTFAYRAIQHLNAHRLGGQ